MTLLKAALVNWKSKGTYFSFKGYKIFYIKEGSGPVLTIFHGYPFNSFDFEKVWDDLIKKFTVIIPDMLGMGFSDKPNNHCYGFDEMADVYVSLLRWLRITETHILSHDLGNSVVQELLARHEERTNPFEINSIAFLNGGLFTDAYKPRFIQRLLSDSPKPIGKIVSRVLSKRSVSKATASVFGANTKPSEELLETFWQILNYNNGKTITYLTGRLVFEKEQHQQRWIKAMQRTVIPMCFINGPADPNSGRHMAKRYQQIIPNANVKMLDEAIGHWPQIEAPTETIQAFMYFLNEINHQRLDKA